MFTNKQCSLKFKVDQLSKKYDIEEIKKHDVLLKSAFTDTANAILDMQTSTKQYCPNCSLSISNDKLIKFCRETALQIEKTFG
jgi:hypothetical protein